MGSQFLSETRSGTMQLLKNSADCKTFHPRRSALFTVALFRYVSWPRMDFSYLSGFIAFCPSLKTSRSQESCEHVTGATGSCMTSNNGKHTKNCCCNDAFSAVHMSANFKSCKYRRL